MTRHIAGTTCFNARHGCHDRHPTALAVTPGQISLLVDYVSPVPRCQLTRAGSPGPAALLCQWQQGTRRSFGRPADSLRPDHISQIRDQNLHLPHPKAMRVDRELGVAAGKARRMEGDVELAVRADQIPHLSRRERGHIVTERQPVRHRLRPDPRTQVSQGLATAAPDCPDAPPE
jgi:hypothetical protein